MSKGKIIHSETYKDHEIIIHANFNNDIGNKINEKWHSGRLTLYCTILNPKLKIVQELNSYLNEFILDSPYLITHKRKIERYGFLNLKKKEHLMHIADEYDRVFPLFLEYSRKQVDNIIKQDKRKLTNQEITNGLPDSLKHL